MKLTLDREDLKEEYQDVNCSQTKFYMFRNYVQSAIVAVGVATFYEYDNSNYNRISDSWN